MGALEAVKDVFTKNLRQSGIYVAFVAIVVLFYFTTNGILLTPQNVSNIVVQNSYILILAIGMVIVIIAGHIDLSVGSVVAFSGAIAGVITVRHNMPWWAGVIGALLVGVIVGIWQGYWVAFVGIPAFIVTLAGMLIFRGAAMVTLGNAQISPFPDAFRNIASGYANGILGGQGIDVFTLVVGGIAVVAFVFTQFRSRMARLRYQQSVEAMPLFIVRLALVAAVVMAFVYELASYKGLPVVLLILGVLILVYSAIAKRSVFGRHVYSIGGNLNAATLSGIKVKWVNFWIFINMGALSALAGVVFTARLNLANPTAGTGFELDAIAACFIGGAAVTGGVGTIVGTITGGLIIGVMNNGMSIMGIGIDYQQSIKGLVLLLAVAFDVYNKRRAGASR